MTEPWSFDNPVYDAIRSYVTTDWGYGADHTLYVLDNMLLTKLATVARDCPDEFGVMIAAFIKEQAIFFIPDIIFEESARSEQTTSEQYAGWYGDLFSQLSGACKIVRVDFQAVYDIMTEGAASLDKGFIKFRLVTMETVRMNPDLLDRVAAATTVHGMKEGIHSFQKDCGERVIHLLVCALLSNSAQSVTVLSNEETGVFKVRQMLARNERLLQLLFMQDKYVFLDGYRLYSFDRLLSHVLSNQNVGDILEFVNAVRDSRDQSRYVRMIFGDESDRSQLDNVQFTDVIVDGKARITF